MRAISLIAAMLAVSALAGCDGEPTHDVAWYKTHEPERQAKITQCNNDPGELSHAPNCKNAARADFELKFSANKSPRLDPSKPPKLGEW
ncbi:hypothetical protein FEP90_05526 [Burkholderia multivorans]|uniref:EexN family lipoprotein n=2 Tax=Burkholderia multivorans TaxID=87883 RepID=UPI0028673CA0|nr:hypothetical protein [Burkholderia multivorans]MDR8769571.1 hypothetical protein [Burkholderia multivorans]MDR8775197.1 hypothetical protein [Burkholderia multivorans]MDR8793532.1 hypothetical protein [Burkholderia multivorans]MDR8799231.1 hypothetical protein [Burkholderia multivorans]